MSALGQKQTLVRALEMSALLPKADMLRGSANVRFVPIADIVQLALMAPIGTKSYLVVEICSRYRCRQNYCWASQEH